MTPIKFFTFTTSRDDRFLCGCASFDVPGDMLTVRTPDGRSQVAEVRGLPAQHLARLLLHELDQAARIERARRRVPGSAA